LNQRIEAGRQYEFSVPMVAPTNKSGKVTGYWQLSDANGSFFGDQVYVEVNISGGGAAAPTSTGAAATSAPTATETDEP
jgi:predicted carbohydrate-binding protein with CBM5 and CBM33 domain